MAVTSFVYWHGRWHSPNTYVNCISIKLFLKKRRGDEQCRYLKEEHLLPSNLVCLGVCQAKRHNQAKEQEMEGFIICSKLGKLEGSFSKQQNWGSFKLNVYTYSWRGLGGIYIFMKGFELKRIQHRIGTKVKRVQALVDWSHKAQKMSAAASLRFQYIWWWSCWRRV